MLDDEVAVDQVKRTARERKSVAQVSDHDGVQRAIGSTSRGIYVHTNELSDTVAIGAEATAAPATRIEHVCARYQRSSQQFPLNFGMRGS